MKLYLDISKWRCGGRAKDKKNRLGRGSTRLKNRLGYMCCLGQFSEQIEPNIKLTDKAMPEDCKYNKNNILVEIDNTHKYCCHTNLSDDCVDINDDEGTTVKEKINKLRNVLKKNGHQLIVKNLSKI